MIYDRQKHWQFLEDELKAEVDEFNEKLNTSASYMLLETAVSYTHLDVYKRQFVALYSN